MKLLSFNNDKIITGICEPNIDPIETAKAINPLLKETPEQKKIDQNVTGIIKKNDDIRKKKAGRVYAFAKYGQRKNINQIDLRYQMEVSPETMIADFTAEEKDILQVNEDEKTLLENEIVAAEIENRAEYKKLIAKKKDLIVSNAVYFEAGRNEKMITDERASEIQGIIAGLAEGETLKLVGDDVEVVAAPEEEHGE
jgi:hypothetical protein